MSKSNPLNLKDSKKYDVIFMLPDDLPENGTIVGVDILNGTVEVVFIDCDITRNETVLYKDIVALVDEINGKQQRFMNYVGLLVFNPLMDPAHKAKADAYDPDPGE